MPELLSPLDSLISASADDLSQAHDVVSADQLSESWIPLKFTWSGKQFSMQIAESDRVFDLKAILQSLTNVPTERQKILGLVKGKLPAEDYRIDALNLLPNKQFTLIGTPEGEELKAPSELPDIDNDLDNDFSNMPSLVENLKHDKRNIRKINEIATKLDVNIITPFREGKRLLVLDIDYTILDTKPLTSGQLPATVCARPGLHEFLEAVYPYYDICIWSQTSWGWLEAKLTSLGMLDGSHQYQISFVLDKTHMFTVFTQRNNKPWTHSVKALPIIWHRFRQFHAGNTIHVDDLSRNFALNPLSGLKISAFRNVSTPQAQADRELFNLARYMTYIATRFEDFTALKHQNWKEVVNGLPPHWRPSQ